MTDNTMEINKPIEGLVAGIISERELAINKGSDHGVKPETKFKVMASIPAEITDPETGEALGTIAREKIRVVATEVRSGFSICRTYRTYQTGGGAFGSLTRSALFGAPRTVHETLKAADADYIPDLPEAESFVKIGDRVTQILEDSMNIDSVEESLRDAVERGVFDKDTVDEAVGRWRRAESVLDEARTVTENRAQKIESALKEYNESSRELTELYNQAYS